ncbi:YARHG domain-containing protein [Pseudaestuariivita rosea]|uniref:YARHG domain-containing protein n=1 Tax=Pseudaestuariivita rosea TaxID=2763263 RepID=UPI001ABA7E35|nr:YARHG domain-containing protein [Pseudaestuariivita rosea]
MKQFLSCLLAVFILCAPVWAANDNPQCNELWFARNAMLDQGGYCFSSPLGQAVFDNSDCITRSPVISAAARKMIELIRRDERALGCGVDTDISNRAPFLRYMSDRMELDVQPPTTEDWRAEFICIDYNGPALNIYSAPETSARVLDRAEARSDISQTHPVRLQDKTFNMLDGSAAGQAWHFVTVFPEGRATGVTGWIFANSFQISTLTDQGGACSNAAG